MKKIMKNRIIFLFLLLGPFLVYGQDGLRPIIDSTVACSYNKGLVVERYFDPDAPNKFVEEVHMEMFYIVEQMPIPEIKLNEIEEELERAVGLNKQEMTLAGSMYFQCIVNCNGKAGDFQIVHCPGEYVNIGCQILNVLRDKLSVWRSGKQRGKDVDVLTMIKTDINSGTFQISVPSY